MKVFEPLEAHAGLTSRRAFYEASQMRLPALPSWDERRPRGLLRSIALGVSLGGRRLTHSSPFSGCPTKMGL